MKFVINNHQYSKIKKVLKEETPETKPENEYTPKQQMLINLINLVESGEYDMEDLENYMGGLDNFIKKLKDENLLNLVDPFDSVWEDVQNDLFLAFAQIEPNFIYKLAENYFSDIEEKNGKYYWKTDYDELSELFHTYRNDISKATIQNILNGEWEHNYWDLRINVYDDIYKELSSENKSSVKEIIKNELKKIETLDVTSDTPEIFEIISNNQGEEGIIKLDDQVIDEILKDNESIEYIFKEMDFDIEKDLYWTYEGCYIDVLYQSWIKDLMRALTEFFLDSEKPEFYTYTKTTYHKNEPVKRREI